MLPTIKATFQDSDTPVWVTHLDGRSVYTNPAGLRLSGRSNGPENPLDRVEGFKHMLQQVARRDRPAHRRTRLAGRDGEAWVSPLQDHHGQTVAALMTFRPAG